MGPADGRRGRGTGPRPRRRAPRDVRVDGRGRQLQRAAEVERAEGAQGDPRGVRRDRGTSDGTAALRLAAPPRARPRPGAHRSGPRSSRRVADMAPAMTWLTWKLVR